MLLEMFDDLGCFGFHKIPCAEVFFPKREKDVELPARSSKHVCKIHDNILTHHYNLHNSKACHHIGS